MKVVITGLLSSISGVMYVVSGLLHSTSCVMYVVTGLLRSASGVMFAADYTYSSVSNDTNVTSGVYNSTRSSVADVMAAAVGVVDVLSEALLSFAAVGDPPAQIITDDVTLAVQRATASNLENATISSAQGSVSLTSVSSLLGSTSIDDCVTSQVNYTLYGT